MFSSVFTLWNGEGAYVVTMFVKESKDFYINVVINVFTTPSGPGKDESLLQMEMLASSG